MGFYGTLVCAALVLAISGASYFQGRQDGASGIQVKWDAAIIEAQAAADADRKKNEAKAKALSKRYEARIATQQVTNREIASQLEIAIGKANLPAACIVSDGVRDAINAALTGASPAGAKLPSAGSGATAAAVQ